MRAAPVQLDLFALATVDVRRAGGLPVSAWRGLAAWHAEIARLHCAMRARSGLYARFDATARLLDTDRIRESRETAAVALLVRRLSAARFPSGELHGLDRVWSRSELGTLIVEATNRATLLRLGRDRPKSKGPTLDPQRLPDDRLAHLIQTHRDLALVATLRDERERRAALTRSHDGSPR